MKKTFGKIKREFKKILKDKLMIGIIVLSLLVFVVGAFIVGINKVLIIAGVVIGLVLLVKFGSKFLKPKRKKKSKRGPKKKTSTWKKLLAVIIFITLCLGILGIIGAMIFFGYIVSSAPEFDKKNLLYKESSILYDINGDEVTRFGVEMRDKVTYDELPQVFVDAIVATEDSRFFEHNGFDLPRFMKASVGQVLGNSSAGGASTISMQVIKNNFTSITKSVTRKFTDIYLAVFKLEKEYTKEQILEFYVNDIHTCVNNTYGVAEATRGMFGKEIGDINLSEAALLAGIFQAPCGNNPFNHPEKAESRRNTVLYLMKRHGYITAEEEKIAKSIPIESMLTDKNADEHPFQSYIDYALKEVEKKTELDPMVVPMKIYTNLDPKKQSYINDVLSGKEYTWENDTVQSGIAVTNINTGAVVALGNGRNRTGKKLLNFATDLNNQIGSTAKPLFDYGPGMEYNNWSTYTPFIDDVHSYSTGQKMNNWDNKYRGFQTLKYTLGQSRNVTALKAFQQVDNSNIVKFVKSLGITPEIHGGMIHEAHSVGGFNGSSPLQMATAYAAFGNGGYYIEPFAVNKIEIIETNEVTTYKPEKVRVMSDSTAYMITDVLKWAVDTTNVAGRISGIEIAGKSGTSNLTDADKKKKGLPASAIGDLWVIGYSPDYSIGMWYGHENITSKSYSTFGTSSRAKDRLFNALAKGIFEKNGKKFTMPKSVVKTQVEYGTIPAMLPSKNTPSDMIRTEFFKKGTEPTEVSPRFDTLNNVKNLDATRDGSKVNLSWSAVEAPNMITDEYLKTIAGHTDKYINLHKQENASLLGTLGYNVYLKKSDGTLSLLGWTSDTKYSHTPTTGGPLTYVVKTCYSIFKKSESKGSEITLTKSPFLSKEAWLVKYPDGSIDKTINVTDNFTIATDDPGIKILVDSVDVTKSSDTIITKTIKNKDGVVVYDKDNIIINLDTSKPNVYTITYSVTYKGEAVTITPPATRKISVVSGGET